MPVIPVTQEAEIRRIMVRNQPQANSSQDPLLKNPSQKRAGGVAQVVECLSSKHEALTSNPSVAKGKKPPSNITSIFNILLLFNFQCGCEWNYFPNFILLL
jgi:hypothetical protein